MAVLLLASYLLHMLLGVTGLVCFVIVAVQMFRLEGFGRGVLGSLCAVYAFFWGLLNAERAGLVTVTRLWSFCIVLAFANLTLWAALRALG